METDTDSKRLKQCFQQLEDCATKCLQQLKSNLSNINDESLEPESDQPVDPVLFNNLIVDDEETELLDQLKSDLENIIDEKLRLFSFTSSNFLFDFLRIYHYDSEKRQFKKAMSIDRLLRFPRDIRGFYDSIDAFAAAFRGDLRNVREFLEKHSDWKNRSGPWRTTMLYSAARNNQLKIVEYLITEVKCSINAQNRRNGTENTAKSEEIYSIEGSTALHGACFHQHLSVVQYLVEHSADYWIRNELGQTATMLAEKSKPIKDYFEKILLRKYLTTQTSSLPNQSVMNDVVLEKTDGCWEYKPINDPKWYAFRGYVAGSLTTALHPTDLFKRDIEIKVDDEHMYNVNLMKFFRSGNYHQDAENQVAWVRFRGSSIANFDCFARWQLMLLTHHQVSEDQERFPSLKIGNLSEKMGRAFQIELDLWYNCDDKTNELLDQTMDRRQKTRSIDVQLIGNDLMFNFETFTFENKTKSIAGYLRWIPKLISNDDRKKHRLVEVDNYDETRTVQPIPFTRAHEKAFQAHVTIDNESVDLFDGDESDEETTTKSDEVFTLEDLTMKIDTIEPIPSANADERGSEEFFYRDVGRLHSASIHEKEDQEGRAETIDSICKRLVTKKEKLDIDIRREEAKLAQEAQKKTEKELEDAKTHIGQLQERITKLEQQERQLRTLVKDVKTIDYRNIDEFLIRNFIDYSLEEIIDFVASRVKVPEQIEGKLPKIIIKWQNKPHFIKVTGLPRHHEEFKNIRQRLETLSNNTKSGQLYYERVLNRTNRETEKILKAKNFRTSDCQCYLGHFRKLLKEKINNHCQSFNEFILEEAKLLMPNVLKDNQFASWMVVQRKTDDYISSHSFTDELEKLKLEALEGFLREKVLIQQIKSEKKPTIASIKTLTDLIDKVKRDLKENPIYKGNTFEQWKHLSKLLQRIMLYYRCFLLQLPLYESSKELLSKIEKSTVLTISTSTGSGKSTLLPALLIAEGYDQVLVTQPRRLPCVLVCQRVNQTMTVSKDRQQLAGWAVSGEESNAKAPILYLTDGLLKESLLKDPEFLRKRIQKNKKIVLFIDEVHERSINIDLCLALIARILKTERNLHRNIRIIISSATLDQSVPTLFRSISNIRFDEFKGFAMGILHPVKKIPRPNENPIDIVLELCKKRQRLDQILCFVSSTALVSHYCSLLKQISNGTLVAYPLIQSQRGDEQQRIIEHGTIFFSTTVAETSLTFPSLTYVIDTGLINVPFYDTQLKRTILKEIQAPESTIKQRLGRLGRTKPGEYYSVYDFNPADKPSLTAQICQLRLTDVEFSLRQSVLQKGLKYLREFLPDPPDPTAINGAEKELQELGIIRSSNKLTQLGEDISALPEFGSLALAKCVVTAFNQYNCGHELIVLSALLSVMNVAPKLSSFPQSFQSLDGDLMTLIKMMNAVLDQRESMDGGSSQIKRICQNLGLISIEHLIKRALRRYDKLIKEIRSSSKYSQKATQGNANWESIARSLISGYEDHIFVSMKDLYGRSHRYIRYQCSGEEYAVLDHKSVLYAKNSKEPVPIILARDIHYSTSIRDRAILAFLGRLEPDWITSKITRTMNMNAAELQKCNTDGIFNQIQQNYPQVPIQANVNNLVLSGPFNAVYYAERMILQRLVMNNKIPFTNEFSQTSPEDYLRMKQNLELVSNTPKIFDPMKWRWKNEAQVALTVSTKFVKSERTSEVSIDGRDKAFQVIKSELKSYMNWLKNSAVVRHIDQAINLRVLKPTSGVSYADIEKRISVITDSKRTSVDLWKSLKGSEATRETRMDVVAWIVVCNQNCTLEGGFVRDRIIGNDKNHPATSPSTWVTMVSKNGINIPELDNQCIPKDLDCHLPSDKSFDLDELLDQFHHYDIPCSYVRDDWRYIFLFDENRPTGPFTMDLIEPHVALTHDRIDFDVNNLLVKKDFTKELGMRVELQTNICQIGLESIVDNIIKKRFQVLRAVDPNMQYRIQKMIGRGWKQLGEPIHVIPRPPTEYPYVLVRLPTTSDLYKTVTKRMQTGIGNYTTIISIEEIKNPLQEEAYYAIKAIIARECKGRNPNERMLFHGTHGDAIKSILTQGFDDRSRRSNGKWGWGTYFADNPAVSHSDTMVDPKTNNRTMFYNKVTLGNEHATQQQDSTLKSAPKDFHSVHGIIAGADEYIVYRYGQGLPYLKITYK